MKTLLTGVFATLFAIGLHAEVTYTTVPLPASIQMDASGKSFPLVKGLAVSYPAESEPMHRNALFAQEYFGMTPQPWMKKVATPVTLALGLKAETPDAYEISIGKNGIRITGASASGVFYGLQTLRKSIAEEK